MVTPGSTSGVKATAHEIAIRTVTALSRTIPPALVGVFVINFFFLYYIYIFIFFFFLQQKVPQWWIK